MRYTDYYATLGIGQSASEQEIRKAYRRLAKDYHPDTHPGDRAAEQKFKELNEAYEVLGDRQKRQRYDQLGAHWNQYQQDLDAEPDAGPKERRRQKPDQGAGIFDLNFSDFFETFFSDQANAFWDQHGSSQTAGPEEKAKKTKADAKDAAKDTSKDGAKDTKDGAKPKEAKDTAKDAVKEPAGKAKSKSTAESGPEFASAQPDLQYFSEISLEESLSGTKRRIQVREDRDLRTIEVKIPAGVKDGSKVRVGSSVGNFFLEIKLKPHSVFSVEGKHLRAGVSAHEYEALLGSQLTVPTLTGTVQMRIPPGSQGGQTFRIRGQGLPDLRQPDQRGDLLVSLEIKIAKNLSEEERGLIEKFKALRQAKKG